MVFGYTFLGALQIIDKKVCSSCKHLRQDKLRFSRVRTILFYLQLNIISYTYKNDDGDDTDDDDDDDPVFKLHGIMRFCVLRVSYEFLEHKQSLHFTFLFPCEYFKTKLSGACTFPVLPYKKQVKAGEQDLPISFTKRHSFLNYFQLISDE